MANKPIKKFSAGAVSASVFRNTTEQNNKRTTYHTVSLQKRYKAKDGSWKTASSLNLNDLPKAALCLNRAYEYILSTPSQPFEPDTVASDTPTTEAEIGSDVEFVN